MFFLEAIMATRDTRAVIGVFRDRSAAEAAIDEMWHTGFQKHEIGLAGPGESLHQASTATGRMEDQAARGAAAGAVTGGLLGAFAGAVAVETIPVLGPVLAGGLLLGVLGGAGAGAALGPIRTPSWPWDCRGRTSTGTKTNFAPAAPSWPCRLPTARMKRSLFWKATEPPARSWSAVPKRYAQKG